MKTTVLQFTLKAVQNPLVLFFCCLFWLLKNCNLINECDVSIGQYNFEMTGMLLNIVHWQVRKSIRNSQQRSPTSSLTIAHQQR